MATKQNIKLKQSMMWVFSVALGSLISICADFILSYFGPSIWFFFYPKFIGVALGSFFAGLTSKSRGWLIGVIISIIHIVYLVSILSHPHAYLTEENIKIDWLALIPTGIFLLATGLICGYLGGVLYQKRKIRRRIEGGE